jgi:hypothetical protein
MAFKDSTLYALWQHLHPVVTNLPVIIRYFIPERYYLHFAVTAVLLFGMGQLLEFNGVPIFAKFLIGYIFGYIPNFAWEWYHARKGNRFDVNDVISGAYGGALVWCLV